MRYIQSEKSFRRFNPMPKPKKHGLFSFLKREKKTVLAPAAAMRATEKPSSRVNPYRREEKTKVGLSLQIKLLFLFALILSWVALAIYLPYFRINKIVYYGLDIIQKDEMEKYIKTSYLDSWGILPHSNYFLASKSKITDLLNQKYSLNRLEVRKKFPNTLEIDLEEKMSSVIYDNGQAYYILDSEGTAIKFLENITPPIPCDSSSTEAMGEVATSTPSTPDIHTPNYLFMRNQYGNYPVLYDKRCLTVTEKQNNILSPKIIADTIAWRDLLEKEGIASVKYFITENPLAGLGAVTNKGLTVYWQPANDTTAQLTNLKTILKSEQPQQYIDLRFGERVYWK